jgi:hypothetical protein
VDAIVAVLLLTLVSMGAEAVCYGVAAAFARIFPSKEMLDAQAVDREWNVEP